MGLVDEQIVVNVSYRRFQVGVESQTGDLCQRHNHTAKQESEREIVFGKDLIQYNNKTRLRSIVHSKHYTCPALMCTSPTVSYIISILYRYGIWPGYQVVFYC